MSAKDNLNCSNCSSEERKRKELGLRFKKREDKKKSSERRREKEGKFRRIIRDRHEKTKKEIDDKCSKGEIKNSKFSNKKCRGEEENNSSISDNNKNSTGNRISSKWIGRDLTILQVLAKLIPTVIVRLTKIQTLVQVRLSNQIMEYFSQLLCKADQPLLVKVAAAILCD